MTRVQEQPCKSANLTTQPEGCGKSSFEFKEFALNLGRTNITTATGEAVLLSDSMEDQDYQGTGKETKQCKTKHVRNAMHNNTDRLHQ